MAPSWWQAGMSLGFSQEAAGQAQPWCRRAARMRRTVSVSHPSANMGCPRDPARSPVEGPRPTSEDHVAAYRITLHAHRRARELGLTINQVREIIARDDVCETMPFPTDDRTGKRLYGRVGAREFHIILVVNPGDTLHTVTTVYEVDHRAFPDGRTRRRQR